MPARKDIVEGLRNALSRGHTLQQAMMSFHNAGYKKQEIEEAARALHEHPSSPMSHPKKPVPKEAMKSTKPLPPESHPTPQTKPPEIKKPEKKPEPKKLDKQMISKYEEKTKPKAKLTLVLLIILLIIVLSVVVGVFIFRDELIDFLSNLF